MLAGPQHDEDELRGNARKQDSNQHAGEARDRGECAGDWVER